MTVILGKYKDGFCRAFFEQLRKYREGLKYGEFIERNFTGGESVLRLTDGKDPDKENSFLNPDKLTDVLRSDKEVIMVYRGGSGKNWRPTNMVLNIMGMGAKLKKPRYGIVIDKLNLFLPNEPCEKQDKSEYRSKRDKDLVIKGEPCTIDEVREQMRIYFDRIATMCAHDFRGKEGWIVKKCRPGEYFNPIIDWEGLSPDDQENLITLSDCTDFLYNIDASYVLENYIEGKVNEFDGTTFVINPDGTPCIRKDRVVNGEKCIDGGHMEKVRNLSSEGQGGLKYNNILELDLSESSVIIPDDTIMSGNTMMGTVENAIGKDARFIRCVGFHGELHDLPDKKTDALSMLREKRTKYSQGANKVKVHTSNSVDTPAYHSPLDILPLGVEKSHEVFK